MKGRLGTKGEDLHSQNPPEAVGNKKTNSEHFGYSMYFLLVVMGLKSLSNENQQKRITVAYNFYFYLGTLQRAGMLMAEYLTNLS